MDWEEYFCLEASLSLSLFSKFKKITDIIRELSPYLTTLCLGKIEIPIPQGVYLENCDLISIGSGTTIEPGSYLKGPLLIGRNCEIRTGSYLRGNVILEDKVIVGHGTEIKNSILLNRAKASHFNYIGDSILGTDTNLGAGVKCANFRFDGEEISIWENGRKEKTGLIKLGVILGDKSQIGCNSVTSPGTLIGKGVFCPPCVYLKGKIISNESI